MSVAICEQPVTRPSATVATANRTEIFITDLIRGNDRRLLDRLIPIVRRQSLALDLSAV